MSLIESIKEKARARRMRIVLPESDEPRTVEAAATVVREGLAEPILLTPERCREKASTYAAALKVLRGECTALTYSGRDVWQGFGDIDL